MVLLIKDKEMAPVKGDTLGHSAPSGTPGASVPPQDHGHFLQRNADPSKFQPAGPHLSSTSCQLRN